MLTGQPPPNNDVRDLFALPARLGGISPINPTSTAKEDYILPPFNPLTHSKLLSSSNPLSAHVKSFMSK